MQPLVSILIPAYNAEEWIAGTIRSALAQTWPRTEIIVVDDGSKDQTLQVARRFESSSVKVFSQKNQGAAAARNYAFSLSHGDYVQWLDADDLLDADKTARQMEEATRINDKRILISGAWARFMHRPYQAKFRPSPLWQDLSPAEWLLRQMEHNVFMQTATWLVSRELAEAAGPWDTRLLGDDDGEFFSRVLLASTGTRFVPQAKMYYRESGASSLSYVGFSDRKLEAQWLSMKLHIGYLRSLVDNRRTRVACVTYMQNWMGAFYPQRMDIFEEARALAGSLGCELTVPRLSWKYAWIDTIFGRPLARRAQVLLPGIKWSLIRAWDKTLWQMEGRRLLNTGIL